jgi:hypothetical protein
VEDGEVGGVRVVQAEVAGRFRLTP